MTVLSFYGHRQILSKKWMQFLTLWYPNFLLSLHLPTTKLHLSSFSLYRRNGLFWLSNHLSLIGPVFILVRSQWVSICSIYSQWFWQILICFFPNSWHQSLWKAFSSTADAPSITISSFGKSLVISSSSASLSISQSILLFIFLFPFIISVSGFGLGFGRSHFLHFCKLAKFYSFRCT